MDQVSHPPPRPLLIFDGDCGFCRLMVSRWREWMHGRVDDEPSQTAAPRFPEIPRENFERSIHLITPDGRVATGAGAAFETMNLCGYQRWLWWLYGRSPVFARTTEAAYGAVARNRAVFSRVARFFYGRDFSHPTFVLGSGLFFRLLGLTYLCAFLSLWSQVIGLAGEHGIVPAADLMAAVRERGLGFWQVPTVCHWTGAGHFALNAICAAGTLCSGLMLSGFVPPLAAAGAWLLYLSLCSVIRVFLNFQWDALLLETGFLAIFLQPPVLRLGWGAAGFSRLARWLLVWLLFRLMFAAGIVKLASRDESWWDLTALTYHYWTTCIPTWTGWYMDKLPLGAQKAACLVNFIIELGVPFLYFLPRRLRHFAALATLSLMAAIAATGNYGFFDLLTAIFCVLLIDDHAWRRWLGRFRSLRPDAPAPAARAPVATWFRRLAVPVLLPVFALTWLPFGGTVVQTQDVCGAKNPLVPPRPAWLVGLHERTGPFRSVNGYGLFASMTKQRDEITLEGSADGTTWQAYEFKWKPGDLRRRPQFCTPHMPRLDWQMWFAALSDIDHQPWLVNTMVRLLEGEPSVAALFGRNPFPQQPPLAVRATVCGYRFTGAAERRATGAWWKRVSEPRLYCPPLRLRPADAGGPARK